MSPKGGKSKFCVEGRPNFRWNFLAFIIILFVKMSIIILMKKYFWLFYNKDCVDFCGNRRNYKKGL